MFQDEDTGEEISCPYCASTEECSHLLAILDRSNCACTSGYAFERYDEFSQLIEKAFRTIFDTGAAERTSWTDPYVRELWGELEYCDGDEDISISGDILTRFVTELLSDAGGVEYGGLIDDGGGPGCSSSITLLHAEEPEKVFESALAELRQRLQPNAEPAKARNGKITNRR